MNKEKVNDSRLFAKVKAIYQSKAENIASSREKINNLLHRVSDKMREIGEIPSVRDSKTQVAVLYRMVKAHVSNEYLGASNRTLCLLVLCLLYFVLPLDFVPDVMTVVRYVDELTVILAIF